MFLTLQCLVAEDEKISKNCGKCNSFYYLFDDDDDDLEEFELVQWDIYHRRERKRCIT